MIPIHSETDYYYNILANNIFDIIARTEFGREMILIVIKDFRGDFSLF